MDEILSNERMHCGIYGSVDFDVNVLWLQLEHPVVFISHI